MVPSIDTLNHTVAPKGENLQDLEAEKQVVGQWEHLARGEMKDLGTLEKETRSMKMDSLRTSVNLFFDRLNPQYPCLNENEFRSMLDSFIGNDTNRMGNGDWYQFMALINLIEAEVTVLTHDGPHSTNAPGRDEFCRAENILNHLG